LVIGGVFVLAVGGVSQQGVQAFAVLVGVDRS
jgi:hypothetical protein